MRRLGIWPILLALLATSVGRVALAQGTAEGRRPSVPMKLAWQPPALSMTPAALQSSGAPRAEAATQDPGITSRWWFWAAVGGVIATTVIVLVVANKEPTPPATTLGNMEGFRGN